VVASAVAPPAPVAASSEDAGPQNPAAGRGMRRGLLNVKIGRGTRPAAQAATNSGAAEGTADSESTGAAGGQSTSPVAPENDSQSRRPSTSATEEGQKHFEPLEPEAVPSRGQAVDLATETLTADGSKSAVPAASPASRSTVPAPSPPATSVSPGQEVSKAASKAGWSAQTGGGWQQNFRRDDQLLRACGLWCKQVEADGACLFRAFADQLEGDDHLELRKKCVAFMEANKELFEPFIEGSYSSYLSKLKMASTWGGEVEVQALTRILKVNALIYQPSNAASPEDVWRLAHQIVNFDDETPCVQLCFHPNYHTGAHYNSVRYIGDSGESKPALVSLVAIGAKMEEDLRGRTDSAPKTVPGSLPHS